MQIYKNASLKPYHTFAVEQTADVVVEVSSIDDIKHVYQERAWEKLPKLILGKGSNVLFTEHFNGVVIINRLLGLEIEEHQNDVHLHVSGGEDWPSFVEYIVNQGITGLENLALIPGCVGSAPVQNIGAYGVELKDVCSYVEYLDLNTFECSRITAEECQFGYRDSIFKHTLKEQAFVTKVGFCLSKSKALVLGYGPLQTLDSNSSSKDIYDIICKIRQEKLPDPNVTGNAGSFFKNPIIPADQFDDLKVRYPGIVSYPGNNGIKVAAGWLIDQCGLKGICVNGACVHENQALVLINAHNATSQDVIQLAKLVKSRVFEEYGISLEHEVRFIGAANEVFLQNFMD
ncbi:UDP-N-acetylmuramate dehydrogenase [Vibrio viridaestus]|uniref:UDP-N-acetylenolpyruvoylglucosamine reductase n=1 Tax=Vibrio viridaestus TaxID=2487322 RepID=A0A3N9TAG5_9VIBR|nr:UDP-N-acetylmuramate dehydrogenase [Vibrio viridaestus]RQW61019.1 UDP-N-acetylmuramate dehydrogenase [Vibrio viridaestus]